MTNDPTSVPSNLHAVNSGADILAILRDHLTRDDETQDQNEACEQAFELAKNSGYQRGDTAVDLLLYLVAVASYETENGTLEESCDELYRLRGKELYGVYVRRNSDGEDEVIWRDEGGDIDYAYLEHICKYAQLPADLRPDWLDDDGVYLYVYGPQNGGRWVTLFELKSMCDADSGRGVEICIDDIPASDYPELLALQTSDDVDALVEAEVRIDRSGQRRIDLRQLRRLTGGKLPMPLHQLAACCSHANW
ncbi:hypothetical protein OKW41_006301 [Paraburkholderia sp. UCT70]|uniref:hypothetical protein n=1 Tax=Paraburkholderia sp. UCT70 TaxID=2991068 RepID=UPI003D1B17AF